MYRIFISYSHQDESLVSKIEEILTGNGLKPMRDRNFAFGTGFHEQIKNFIAHAHVFLPVITDTSDARKWVHQEIGFAMALNIPMLPIAVGEKLPDAMLQQIHAVRIGEDLEIVKKHLSWEMIHGLVLRHSAPSQPLYQCAEFAEERATLMVKYSREVIDFGIHAELRQKGALSSLHIPSKTINHPVWKARYGGIDRGPGHCNLQREERLALEEHVRSAGCKLIINPNLNYEQYGGQARIVRIECLIEFLKSMVDSPCQVAINTRMGHEESLTILGDWFAAESVSARVGRGYRQTVFTRHAPSMLGKIEAFDQEFKELLDDAGWAADTSREAAIAKMSEIVAELKNSAR